MSELDTQSVEQTEASPVETQTDSSTDAAPQSEADRIQALIELDKVEKFKLEGKEYTLKELQAERMRHKDYTQKTQALAKEREQWQSYRDNYKVDLAKVRKDPRLASEFVRVYPEEYHDLVAEYLKAPQTNNQEQSQYQGPQVDMQLLSDVQMLKKSFHEQEVAKQEQAIAATVDKFSKQYPDAANFKELVLGRAYEANMGGAKLNDEAWENIFKQVDTEVKDLLKSKYGELVKKQTEANVKAKDAKGGGGTVGKSPKKFSSFRELNEHAFPGLTGGQS